MQHFYRGVSIQSLYSTSKLVTTIPYSLCHNTTAWNIDLRYQLLVLIINNKNKRR